MSNGRTFVAQISTQSTRPFAFVASDMMQALKDAGFYGVTITGGEPYEQERALLLKERNELSGWYGTLRAELLRDVADFAKALVKGEIKPEDAQKHLELTLIERLRG